MKKIIFYVISLVMFVTIAAAAVKASGVLENHKSMFEKENTSENESIKLDTKNLSEFEINALINCDANEIFYLNEKCKSQGFEIKVDSYEIVDDLEEMGDFKNEFENWSDDKDEDVAFVVNIEVTNIDAGEKEDYTEKGEDFNLSCFWLEYMDEKGEDVNGEELIYCTNEKNNPESKEGFSYPLKKNETYKGKLYYIVNKKDLETKKFAIAAGFLLNQHSEDSKLIMLENR